MKLSRRDSNLQVDRDYRQSLIDRYYSWKNPFFLYYQPKTLASKDNLYQDSSFEKFKNSFFYPDSLSIHLDYFLDVLHSISEDDSGLISDVPFWQAFDPRGYWYMASNLEKLIDMILFEFEDDRHLVG